MTNEEIAISGFLKTQYTDEKLAALLAHADDGKLAFWSCCCFAGVPTATHALHGADSAYDLSAHMDHPNFSLQLRREMSNAYSALGDDDEERRAKLIPLIRAEMSRREALRNLTQELSDLGEVLKVSV